jgi:hypothetical protein
MVIKKGYLLMIILAFLVLSCDKNATNTFQQTISFESSEGEKTATYAEMVSFYSRAAEYSDKVNMQEMDTTDAGLPLHLITFSNTADTENPLNILINNGIHPGESDGIDASMLLLRDLINNAYKLPENVVLHIIPCYNLGGMLDRNSTTRANQNGPEAYGFRGNAQNYDLNRDFIKMDTKNMEAFAEIYHNINPDIYIETHVSNGADYQYTLTHLITQHNKLRYDLGAFTEKIFRTELEESIQSKGFLITPYVNVFGRTPDKGFSQFFDAARYSTGYTTLWNTLGLMIETHMLKPYKERVIQTKAMLQSVIEVSAKHKNKIQHLREKNFQTFKEDKYYKFDYVIDSTAYDILNFKGYRAKHMESEVTNLPRLKYFRDQPETFPVRYYQHFKAQDSILIPDYYVVTGAWQSVLERLKKNKVEFSKIKNDTTLNVETYSIESFNTYNSAYEGHYLHYNTKVKAKMETLSFKKGDILIPTQQKSKRYIIETLEPELKDSFFNWNFFDSILQQKEGFSAYVFEDYAEAFLKDHPEINKEFQLKKQSDTNFRNNAYLQLNWIYKKCPLYERAHLRYPVFRMFD